MNNPIIFIIIAVVLIAAAAWFFLQKKNKTKTETPKPVANPVPRHLEDKDDSEPVPAPIPERDYLKNAQELISNQRYDEAETELKSGLKAAPKDSGMMLKLLNVYALTHNRDAFDSVYGELKSSADTTSIRQADELKSMLDEEASLKEAAETAKVEPQSESIDNEPLEFNLDDDLGSDTTELQPSSGADSEEEVLSFDDLESQLLDETTPTTEDVPTSSSAQDDGSFDLSDELDLSDDLELDIASEDTPASDSADDGDFDFSELEENADLQLTDSADTTTLEIAPASNETEPDFDLSLDDELEQPTASAVEPTQELSLDDLDSAIDDDVNQGGGLSFGDGEESTPVASDEFAIDELSVADVSQQPENEVEVSNDLEVSMDDDSLSLDELSDADVEMTLDEEVTPEPEAQTNAGEFDLADFDLEDNGDSASTEPANTSDEVIHDVVHSDLELEATTLEDTNEDYDDTLSQLDALSEDELLGATAGIQDEKTSPLSAAESAPVIDDSEFMQSFGFVQELDNSQITLDLANQYLELGEYDSARRLVNEVIDSDISEEHKATAREILSRMN